MAYFVYDTNKDWSKRRLPRRTKETGELPVMNRRMIMEVKKTHMERFKNWNKEEKKIMQKYYPTEGAKVAGRLSGKTEHQIWTFASANNIKFIGRKPGAKTWKKWMPKDLKYLIKNYNSMSKKDIAKHLGRTYGSVVRMAQELGITKEKKLFTEEEKLIMEQFYETEGIKVLERMGHTHSKETVKSFAYYNGLRSNVLPQHQTTQAEVDAIESLKDTYSVKTISRVVGKSEYTVRGKIELIEEEQKKPRVWEKNEEEYLTMHYSAKGPASCAEFLGRTIGSVYHRASKLGVSCR